MEAYSRKISSQQVLINSLRCRLERKETECEDFREEQQQFRRQRREAVLSDTDQEIEKFKKCEKNLQKILDEHEKMMMRLQEEVVKSRKRKRELEAFGRGRKQNR